MSPLRERVEEHLKAGRVDLAFDALIAARLDKGADLEMAWAARDLLPRIVERLPACAFDPPRRECAARCGLTLPGPQKATGRLEFPAVNGPRARMVRVDVVVTAEAEDDVLPEGLASETAAALRAALAAVRRGLPSELAAPRVRVALDHDPPPWGPSCGLAMALAARSALCRLPIDDDLAATGELTADGRVRPVSDVADKRLLHRAARPGGRLLVPLGQEDPKEPSVHAVVDLETALAHLGSAPERDLSGELAEIRSAFNLGRWPEAAQRAQSLCDDPGLQEGERAELLLILLAAANHRGDQALALALVARLRPLLESGGLTASVGAQALAHVATAAIDRFAVADAEVVLAQARLLALPPGDEGWLHVRGAQAAAALLRGDFERALALRRQNAAASGSLPTERPRCLGDLADTLRRCGLFAEANVVLDEASAALERVGQRRLTYKATTRRFLHLHAARLALAAGDAVQAAAHLPKAAGTPGPGPVAALEDALLAGEREERLRRIDAALLERADVPVFQALRARARYLAGDPGAAEVLGACMALPGVPAEELCRRLPY